jgi:hypothetical protein
MKSKIRCAAAAGAAILAFAAAIAVAGNNNPAAPSISPSPAFLSAPAASPLLSPANPLAPGRSEDREYKIEAKEEIRKSFPAAEPGRPMELFIDNIFGGIDVRAADVAAVEVAIRKTIKAESADRAARAKAEVELKITHKGNTVDLFVDGPFRDEERRRRTARWNDPGYIVVYEFSVKVPRRTRLGLKTVTDGDVAVRGVEGGFDVSNVNGKVTLEGLAGAGRADTVNGDLRAAFARNPGGACSFKTVNGDVDLTFREGLAADFRLKSMMGEALSDFAVAGLPDEPLRREQREGRTIFRREGFTGVRVGRGGPVIRCETLNGDILIRKSK